MKNLRPLRPALALVVAFLLSAFSLPPSAFSAPASAVTLTRVLPGYQTADHFKRISEYFDAKENPSGQILLRTNPTSRDGYYFLLRLKNTGPALTAAAAELQLITPASPNVVTHTFPIATLPTGSRIVQLGLTGPDWPDAQAHPVAWQLRLLTADGTELLRHHSHLWQ